MSGPERPTQALDKITATLKKFKSIDICAARVKLEQTECQGSKVKGSSLEQTRFGDVMPEENGVRGQEDPPPLPAPDPEPAESGFVLYEEPEVASRPVRPARPPHPGFWWAVLWCLGIIVVTQVVPGILGIVILLFRSAGTLTPEQLRDSQALAQSQAYAEAMLPALVVSQVLSVAMAWLAIRLFVGKQWPRVLALRWPSWSHLLLAVMGLPGLMVVAMGVDGLARQVLPSLGDLEQTMALFGKWPWPVGVLVIGLGPGIGEELWFRGFLGRGLVSRHGVTGGVLLSSLLFGLIHLEPRQIAYAAVIGVLLHLSYLATRSLLIPVLLHTANNSLGILAMHSSALRAIDMPAEQIPWYVYGTAILLVTVVGWALWRTRTLLVDRSANEGEPWRPAFAGVEHPPSETATGVLHRAPDRWTWLLALAGLAAFAGAVVPVAIEASEKANPQHEKRKPLASASSTLDYWVAKPDSAVIHQWQPSPATPVVSVDDALESFATKLGFSDVSPYRPTFRVRRVPIADKLVKAREK